MVPAAFRLGEQAGPEGGDRGVGPQAADRLVAVRGARRTAGRRPGKGLAVAGGFDGAAPCQGSSGAGVRGRESRAEPKNPGEKGDVAAAAEVEEARSERAAVVPPGDPAKAPFVRWVGPAGRRAGRSTRTRYMVLG